jgi:class 3 adenylate cyclase
VGYQELAIPQAGDSYPTAFQNRLGVDLSGVEIAATAFSNLLHDEALKALPEWARVALVGVLGVALTLASCLGMVWRGLAATLALAAAYGAVAASAFVLWHVWLPVVVPLLGLLPLAVVLGQVVHYLGAARWLGVYAPRQVSRQLLQGRDFAAGRAQRREVTVMLTDIVGFTTLAERSTPEAVAEFVNRHFTMLTRCVEDEGGTVAQFIGDSVMAFWGAPDPQPDHAARACRAALAIGRALEAENALRQRQDEPLVRMRIGVNTGPVTAGNVGAPGRSNYGIVGDAVNTTQRIEQLAKDVCLDRPTLAVLVSATTRLQAGDRFRFTDAGAHAVRGRQELVRIFRLGAPLPEIAEAAGGGARLRLVAGHG